MQVGPDFFNGPRASQRRSRSQESFKNLEKILRPEGTMSLTYLKRVPIGPQQQKLSQM